jgi:hypothetical protein
MTYDGSVLYALAESPVTEGVIWAGTNDGQLSLTRDGGDHWQNVSANLEGIPEYGQVANIEPSRWDAGTAYVAIDLHQMADFDPYILETTDFGRTWKRIDTGIEHSQSSFVHVVREDPVRKGMLYAGTDNGVWFTLDDGAHWQRIRGNLPAAPVYWLVVQPHFNDLVVATYGRGFWILDDVTSLRGLTPEILAGGPHLFKPRPAYRFRSIYNISEAPNSNVPGQNPPYGADVDLYLPERAAGPVTATVADAQGNVVRTLHLQGTAGINRIQWDLRYESPEAPRLRTPPPDMPWVSLGPDGTRRLRTWDLDLAGGQQGPLAAPGTYQVSVDVGGRHLTTSVEVLKDPHSAGTLADIQAQVALSLQLRTDLNRVGTMIDRMEWVRAQVEQTAKMLEDDTAATALYHATEAFHAKLLDVEGRLFDIHLSGSREDAFRNPMKLYGRLSALASDVGANGADFAPTEQQIGVHDVLRQRLDEASHLMDALLSSDLRSLNARLAEKNAPVISSQEEGTEP